jgi:hypothetical protein
MYYELENMYSILNMKKTFEGGYGMSAFVPISRMSQMQTSSLSLSCMKWSVSNYHDNIVKIRSVQIKLFSLYIDESLIASARDP